MPSMVRANWQIAWPWNRKNPNVKSLQHGLKMNKKLYWKNLNQHGNTRGPFYLHGLTLIPAWISNYTHYEVLYEITCATVEVWEWISNFIPHFTGHVITYPCHFNIDWNISPHDWNISPHNLTKSWRHATGVRNLQLFWNLPGFSTVFLLKYLPSYKSDWKKSMKAWYSILMSIVTGSISYEILRLNALSDIEMGHRVLRWFNTI